MSLTENTNAINIRYGKLAENDCCLSCGGAINYVDAKAGEICADLGSGRGTDVFRLAEQVGTDGFVFGLDISDGMLKKAEKTASKLNIKNVKFEKTVLEKLPLENSSLNLIISNCTINHAENKQFVWNEIFRVLKAGGRFVVSDIFSTAPVPEKYRTDPEAIAECWAGSVEKEVYLTQLKKAGFNDISIIEESKPYKKGEIDVVSWTIYGKKTCGCDNCNCK